MHYSLAMREYPATLATMRSPCWTSPESRQSAAANALPSTPRTATARNPAVEVAPHELVLAVDQPFASGAQDLDPGLALEPSQVQILGGDPDLYLEDIR